MTAQASDWIYYKSERFPLLNRPLTSYWDKDHPRPIIGPFTSANRQGYIATWALLDGVLHLESVSGHLLIDGSGNTVYETAPFFRQSDVEEYPGDWSTIPVEVERLFPGSQGHVPAVWFTGTLRVARGEMLCREPFADGAIYEEELLLEVRQGRVIRTDVQDNRSTAREILHKRQSQGGPTLKSILDELGTEAGPEK